MSEDERQMMRALVVAVDEILQGLECGDSRAEWGDFTRGWADQTRTLRERLSEADEDRLEQAWEARS